MSKNESNTPLLGVPYGIRSLDEATSGLRGLVYLAGETGTGKTSLAFLPSPCDMPSRGHSSHNVDTRYII